MKHPLIVFGRDGRVVVHVCFDDGGRAAADMPAARAGDCAARAIAIACSIPYLDACSLIDEFGQRERSSSRRRGARSGSQRGVFGPTMRRIMEHLGWTWTPTMRIGSGCTVHVRADELPRGRLVLALSRHYAAFIDGVLYDTHDSSREGTRCVYGYWKMEDHDA